MTTSSATPIESSMQTCQATLNSPYGHNSCRHNVNNVNRLVNQGGNVGIVFSDPIENQVNRPEVRQISEEDLPPPYNGLFPKA